MAHHLDRFASQIETWLKEGRTNVEIVSLLSDRGAETSETSIRRYIKKNGSLREAADVRSAKNSLKDRAWAEGIKFNESKDEAEVVSPFYTEDIAHLTVEQVMNRHELDPEEWEAKRVLPNVWEANAGNGTKIPLYQFKVWFNKKVPLMAIFPATEPTFRFSTPKPVDLSKPILNVVFTDQQLPFRLEPLHELFLRWVRKNQPYAGILGGDLLDFGYISRHRDDPAWHSSVQECIQSGFDTIYDYRNAFEDCQWSLIRGNHDVRLRNEMLERSERLYGVTAAQYPGDEPEEWVYSLNHLLHLKRLGVNYVEPKGTYEFEQVPITDMIAVRHGHKVVANGALKTANELGHSIVLGHTHRQSINRQTVWNSIKEQWHVITAVEAGCGCEIVGGLGFARGGVPDWQPGFATVTTWPDGNFTTELATYEQSGQLRWRDQLYSL